uniref:Uncharacterized protein n=1 Tax=Arundo donax TaxID=35708 RepID=A0A0A9F3B4_ARUDO
MGCVSSAKLPMVVSLSEIDRKTFTIAFFLDNKFYSCALQYSHLSATDKHHLA